MAGEGGIQKDEDEAEDEDNDEDDDEDEYEEKDYLKFLTPSVAGCKLFGGGNKQF